MLSKAFDERFHMPNLLQPIALNQAATISNQEELQLQYSENGPTASFGLSTMPQVWADGQGFNSGPKIILH
jgi:hypothetical protein